MSQKNWLGKVFLCIIGFAVLLVFIVDIVIDPYGEYNVVRTPFNQKKFFQSEITTPMKLYDKLKTGQYTLVFGTSHSSTISKSLVGTDVLNFSVSLYGNPVDVYSFLSKLNSTQTNNIKQIYFLLDYHTFDNGNRYLDQSNFDSREEYYIQSVKNINCDKLYKCLDCVIKNLTKKQSTEITDNGEFIYAKEINFRDDMGLGDGIKIKYTYGKSAMEALGKINRFAKTHNIKIVYFKSVFSSVFLKHVDLVSMERQYKDIIKETGGFYSLQYIDGISDNISLFRNPTHHNFLVTRQEVEILQNPHVREKYFVNNNNVDQYFIMLKTKLLN